MLFNLFGYAATICMVFGYLPQAIRTIRTRQTDDIALLAEAFDVCFQNDFHCGSTFCCLFHFEVLIDGSLQLLDGLLHMGLRHLGRCHREVAAASETFHDPLDVHVAQ